jgi:hypothetical protein
MSGLTLRRALVEAPAHVELRHVEALPGQLHAHLIFHRAHGGGGLRSVRKDRRPDLTVAHGQLELARTQVRRIDVQHETLGASG